MHQTSHSSKPASYAEISSSLQMLFDALPFQRGAKSDNVAMAYIEALSGTTVDALHAGIRKFLRGECQDINPRYVPTPPELARIVRGAVVQNRVPEERRIAPFRHSTEGERDRMKLKFPMLQYAWGSPALMDKLANANRDGFGAMVALATDWGVKIPEELLTIPDDEAERRWHLARNRAWAEIERNPPPFLINERKKQHQPAKAA